jgi:zinc transport system substrate-binding protein
MRRGFIGIALVAALSLLAGCGGPASGSAPRFEGGTGKVKVAASFYPIYEFVKAVGGDQVDAVLMVPAGTEPHDWEPTPKHMTALGEAQLFIYSGVGMETWVDKTLKSIDNKDLTVLEASRGLELIVAEEAGHGADDGHGHAPGELDPHVWLDPRNVVHQVEAIRDVLVTLDASNRAAYEANAAAYIGQVKALDAEMAAGLSQCKRREFFTTHAAFGYLAHRYDLEQHAIMGLTPDAEPKPKDLAAIVTEAKEQQVTYIFFETLVSDKVANMVAGEIGAKTLVLNPFEGLTDVEVQAGKSYLTVMRDNLANLKLAMECGN